MGLTDERIYAATIARVFTKLQQKIEIYNAQQDKEADINKVRDVMNIFADFCELVQNTDPVRLGEDAQALEYVRD